MRKTSRLIGCFALLALTGSSVASTGYSFSKPNTDHGEFRDDQRMCERRSYITKLANETPRVRYTYTGTYNQIFLGPTRAAHRDDSDGLFISCMLRRGYHFDAAGLSTGPLWTWVKHW
jgi:hypothetical protein